MRRLSRLLTGFSLEVVRGLLCQYGSQGVVAAVPLKGGGVRLVALVPVEALGELENSSSRGAASW